MKKDKFTFWIERLSYMERCSTLLGSITSVPLIHTGRFRQIVQLRLEGEWIEGTWMSCLIHYFSNVKPHYRCGRFRDLRPEVLELSHYKFRGMHVPFTFDPGAWKKDKTPLLVYTGTP